MAFAPLDRVTPQRERELRRMWKHDYQLRGFAYPRLAQIGMVELDKINVPTWAQRKAVRGLSITADTVWLKRIAARALMRQDEDYGGTPKVTWTYWRPCKLCKRPLLGLEAEARRELDRKIFGWTIPCGPECYELEDARRERKGSGCVKSEQAKPTAKRQRNGKATSWPYRK